MSVLDIYRAGVGAYETEVKGSMAQAWADRFYHSKEWKAVRREVLRRDHYTCSECYGRGEEVHHLIALTPDNINDRKISLNPENLISMCHKCHTNTTKGYTGAVSCEFIFDDDGQVIQASPLQSKQSN